MADPNDDDNQEILAQNNPNLVQLLTDRLPALGLDYETYGPYIWGVVGNNIYDGDKWEIASAIKISDY